VGGTIASVTMSLGPVEVPSPAMASVSKSFAGCPTVGLSPGMAQALHSDEIPIDVELVRGLVSRAMPAYADAPISRLTSSGSTNVLFRLGEELLVRLPRQPGGSTTISKEAEWSPVVGPHLPVAVPDVVAVFEPDRDYPESWSVVRWIEGAHPEVVDPDTSVDPRREDLATDLIAVLDALRQAEVPADAINLPQLHSYRGDPLATMDDTTRQNLEQCRALEDFEFDLDAAEQIWTEAMALRGVADRTTPHWYHGDLAAENLLTRDGALSAVLDFGSLAVGDPTVDLMVAWEILDPPARELFRQQVGVDDATWLRGRAWALSISLMIWYYWTTMPKRRARSMAVGRNVLADAGCSV
jgi:aminoglycoside phosphotransferase (APT) family kinase protein